MIDVPAYLASKGLKLKGSGNNVHTTCFFCHEDPVKPGRLYINVGGEDTAGLYLCHLCGAKGNLVTLQRHFGDESEHPDAASLYTTILGRAAQFYASVNDTMATDFLTSERGLSAETIERHQLGFAPGRWALWEHLRHDFPRADVLATGLVVERDGRCQDFLQEQVTIPYHVHGMVAAIRGREIGGKYLTPPGTKARLFNVDAAEGANEVVLTEGEFDALTLEQLGFAALGVPGAGSYQQHWNDYFVDARRVYVVFDPDQAGRAGTEKVLAILGSKAKPIDLPVEEGTEPKDVDPSFLVVDKRWGKDDFDVLFVQAARANTVLVSVQEAFIEWQDLQAASGLKLGYEVLDRLLKPGLLPGQVMVPLAKTSTGKTLLLLNMMERASHVNADVKVLFISLEQTRAEWFERARRIWYFYHPCSPSSHAVLWKQAGKIGWRALNQWIDQETQRYWGDRLWIIDRNRLTEEQVNSAIEEYAEITGDAPDLVLLDYLGYWANAAPGNSRYEKVSNAVMSLKAIAKEWRVPVIAPHQVSRSAEFGVEFQIDQGRESGVVEETADFALTLWNSDDLKGKQDTYGKTIRREDNGNTGGLASSDHTRGSLTLKIGKSRHGGKGRECHLHMGKLSLAMVPHEDTVFFKRVCREDDWDARGITWEQAIYSHHLGLAELASEDVIDYRNFDIPPSFLNGGRRR
jgi:KaiC/GvpD/RAD55 family RecA-like ATPase